MENTVVGQFQKEIVMNDLTGHSLGQYHIIEEIGRGGMATVYRATQTSIGRDVAIKVLPSNLTHDKTFLKRFEREVEIVANLQHPHILPVYDFGEYEGMPYIVMAYLRGGTLSDKMSRGALSLSEIERVTRQIADALEYAHSRGIIHRDFKPSNVLLDEQGNTYLADFGLAKLSESTMQITGTGILGTPTYMAPEQAEPGDLTTAADVYALGVTIFQMLTGRVPYEAPTPLGVVLAHVTQPIPSIHSIRPDLPEQMQTIVSRGMAKKVADRYATPTHLANALIQALGGNPLGETQEVVTMIPPSLLMTNMLGHVIFVDNTCLKLLKRHHSEARTVIGKPLAEVIGVDRKTADQIIQDVNKGKRVLEQPITITDSQGNKLAVLCTAAATHDDKGAFVGADISLQVLRESEDQFADFKTISERLDTIEESFLQTYFTAQLESIRNLLMNMGGKRVAANLEKIINETSQRNVWPVSMRDGKIDVNLRSTDSDIYRALLAKAITYAASVMGPKLVAKEMAAVDKKMDARVLGLIQQLGLQELLKELL
jgi:serine/threonine protein kinase